MLINRCREFLQTFRNEPDHSAENLADFVRSEQGRAADAAENGAALTALPGQQIKRSLSNFQKTDIFTNHFKERI